MCQLWVGRHVGHCPYDYFSQDPIGFSLLVLCTTSLHGDFRGVWTALYYKVNFLECLCVIQIHALLLQGRCRGCVVWSGLVWLFWLRVLLVPSDAYLWCHSHADDVHCRSGCPTKLRSQNNLLPLGTYWMVTLSGKRFCGRLHEAWFSENLFLQRLKSSSWVDVLQCSAVLICHRFDFCVWRSKPGSSG